MTKKHTDRRAPSRDLGDKGGGRGAKDSPFPARDKAGEPREVGGPKGPEPTRYGDWERDGRCVDF